MINNTEIPDRPLEPEEINLRQFEIEKQEYYADWEDD